MLLLVLLFIIVKSQNTPAPPQCPAPEDRLNAEFSGKTCDFFRSGCCFNEVINENKLLCCYVYSLKGTLKCCGYDGSEENVNFYLFVFFIALLCILVLLFCYALNEKAIRNKINKYF